MTSDTPHKPIEWHGVPRSAIDWHPNVDVEKCIGCGLCVLTCGKRVHHYHRERKKSEEVHPESCFVACQTCANLCPVEVISFAEEGDDPRSKAQRLLRERKILHYVKKELEMMQS